VLVRRRRQRKKPPKYLYEARKRAAGISGPPLFILFRIQFVASMVWVVRSIFKGTSELLMVCRPELALVVRVFEQSTFFLKLVCR
jgi:hypothetical protein